MPLTSPLSLPATADMHVHLRQDEAMLRAVVPTIRAGGADTVYVMPNLTPPLTAVADVLAYHARLQALAPDTKFLMTLYLHSSVTPATIAEAAAAGGVIRGVKLYPAGVTTNSAAGVSDWRAFWPVFAAMQRHGLVLNLHGEALGSEADGVTVLNAEHKFLPTLLDIHAAFPELRIVLEHCTSAAAVQCVREQCGPTVACTVTAHHLWLTADAWRAGDARAHNWCKPAAKTEEDRRALIHAVIRGGPKVMFGSDSAPHPRQAKDADSPAAGCFTQGWTTQLVVGALEEGVRRGWIEEHEVTERALAEFLGGNARAFYGLGKSTSTIVLERKDEKVPLHISATHDDMNIEVVPFRAGHEVWSLRWE